MATIADEARTGTTPRAAAAELQAAARAAYQQSARQGDPLTGAEIGRRFGRSDRWGRDRIAEARRNAGRPDQTAEMATGANHRHRPEPTGGGNGSHNGNGSAAPSGNGNQDHDNGTSPPAATDDLSGHGGTSRADGGTSSPHPMEAAAPPAAPTRRVNGSRPTPERQPPPADLAADRQPHPAGILPWFSLLAGVGASLAANMAAAEPTALGRAVAGWSPLALLLSFEMLLRIGRDASATRTVRAVTIIAVIAVAVVAAIVSYEHMREVAERVGEGWRSYLLPISVDGMILASSMVLLSRPRTRPGDAPPV